MEKIKQKSTWLKKESIPNWLTILRIIFVPIVVVFILISQTPTISNNLYHIIYKIIIDNQLTININGSFLTAGIFFILASITDALDGFLARKFKWVSDFGKLWDPLADKLLTNSVLICFGAFNYIPIWLALIFVIRDIVINGYRMLAAKSQVVVAANWYGKIKTILMMVGIVYIFFLGSNLTNSWYYWAINNLLIYFAAMFSIASGIIYMINISKELKIKKIKDNTNKEDKEKTNTNN